MLIDNYDSFTYNLVQAFLVLGAEVDVHRNDAITVDAALRQSHTHLVISPGPGTPRDAGVSMRDDPGLRRTHPDLRRVPRAPVPGRGIRRQGRACGAAHARQSVAGAATTARECSAASPQDFQAGRYHSLIAEPHSIPAVLEVTARTAQGEIMGVRHRSLPIEGVQFHPESVLTPEGPVLMGNFLKT